MMHRIFIALLLLLNFELFGDRIAIAMTIDIPTEKQAAITRENEIKLATLSAQGDYKVLTKVLQQQLKADPTNIFLRYLYLHTYYQMGLHGKLIKELEAQLASFEQQKLRYAIYYFLLFDTYYADGKLDKAKNLAKTMTRYFAHRKDLMTSLLSRVRPFRDQTLNQPILENLKKISTQDQTALRTLYALKPKPKQKSAATDGMEMLVETGTIPRFRFLVNKERSEASSGVARYLVGPPNYSQVNIVNDESKNYYSCSIAEMLMNHCNEKAPVFHYSKAQKVGEQKIFGIDCDVYKCDYTDESLYDLICLAPSIDISQGICASICETCRLPQTQCLPLCMQTPNFLGRKFRLLVLSLKHCKTNNDSMKLPTGYHRVKSMSELIYAEAGELSGGDIDDLMESTKVRTK